MKHHLAASALVKADASFEQLQTLTRDVRHKAINDLAEQISSNDGPMKITLAMEIAQAAIPQSLDQIHATAVQNRLVAAVASRMNSVVSALPCEKSSDLQESLSSRSIRSRILEEGIRAAKESKKQVLQSVLKSVVSLGSVKAKEGLIQEVTSQIRQQTITNAAHAALTSLNMDSLIKHASSSAQLVCHNLLHNFAIRGVDKTSKHIIAVGSNAAVAETLKVTGLKRKEVHTQFRQTAIAAAMHAAKSTYASFRGATGRLMGDSEAAETSNKQKKALQVALNEARNTKQVFDTSAAAAAENLNNQFSRVAETKGRHACLHALKSLMPPLVAHVAMKTAARDVSLSDLSSILIQVSGSAAQHTIDELQSSYNISKEQIPQQLKSRLVRKLVKRGIPKQCQDAAYSAALTKCTKQSRTLSRSLLTKLIDANQIENLVSESTKTISKALSQCATDAGLAAARKELYPPRTAVWRDASEEFISRKIKNKVMSAKIDGLTLVQFSRQMWPSVRSIIARRMIQSLTDVVTLDKSQTDELSGKVQSLFSALRPSPLVLQNVIQASRLKCIQAATEDSSSMLPDPSSDKFHKRHDVISALENIAQASVALNLQSAVKSGLELQMQFKLQTTFSHFAKGWMTLFETHRAFNIITPPVAHYALTVAASGLSAPTIATAVVAKLGQLPGNIPKFQNASLAAATAVRDLGGSKAQQQVVAGQAAGLAEILAGATPSKAALSANVAMRSMNATSENAMEGAAVNAASAAFQTGANITGVFEATKDAVLQAGGSIPEQKSISEQAVSFLSNTLWSRPALVVLPAGLNDLQPSIQITALSLVTPTKLARGTIVRILGRLQTAGVSLRTQVSIVGAGTGRTYPPCILIRV